MALVGNKHNIVFVGICLYDATVTQLLEGKICHPTEFGDYFWTIL